MDEWLIETIIVIYEFSNSAVRVSNTACNKFNVKAGVHQRSVLSLLLFNMVHEALSRVFRSGLPWKMLYADDLVIITESLVERTKRAKV